MRNYIILSDDIYMAEGLRHLLFSMKVGGGNTVNLLPQMSFRQAQVVKGQHTVIHCLPRKASLKGLIERLSYLSKQRGVVNQLILCDDFHHILRCLPWHIANLKVLNSLVSFHQLKACISEFSERALPGEHSESDQPYFGLPPRQREVLYLLSRGLTNNEVSTIMDINNKTVSIHKKNAQSALKLTSRTDYVRFLNLFREFLSRGRMVHDQYRH